MEIWHFPLVCWQMTPDLVVGKVVGAPYQLVASSAKRIKQSLSREMQRLANTNPDSFDEPVKMPQLEIVKVQFRPTYRDPEAGTFPAGTVVTIPVVAVHGQNNFGAFTCHLPLLGDDFHFYKAGQVDSMVEHFARNRFHELEPEQLHRYLLIAAPWLETVSIKVERNEKRRKKRRGQGPEPMETVEGVGERHPLDPGARKSIRAFPAVAWEREELVRLVADAIGKERANVLVVGERGVGKSAILAEAVSKAHGETASSDRPVGRFYWKTNAHRMIAGARWLGDWQEIVERLMADLQLSGDALWITDFVELFRVGGEGPEDSVAAYLSPNLDRGELQIIGEATPHELEAARTLLPGFLERFRVIHVEELSRPAMLRVLDKLSRHARTTMQIDIEREALETAHRSLGRFVPYERFPGKAVKFLSTCVSEAWLKEHKRVGRREVLDAFIAQTGLPELFLRDDLVLEPGSLRGHFASQVIGQEEALEKVSRVVKVFKAGLNDPAKPIGVMLFAGPTGVGKTATAKALAEFFFGAGQKLDPLVRLDMSEFQHPAQIERLIGSGRGEPGKLVQQVRERPFSVVLLDEIEKAHPLFFDALLAVLDEGRLVDAYGRVTDFRNTIIVMTTNLGSRRGGSLGFGKEDANRFDAEVRGFFRPEFYNRLDQVVTFKALTAEVILEIARKELKTVAMREGFAKMGLKIEFSEAVIRHVAEVGFDPQYGARPLQRAIEQRIVGPLARWMITNQVRDASVRVDIVDGEVRVSR